MSILKAKTEFIKATTESLSGDYYTTTLSQSNDQAITTSQETQLIYVTGSISINNNLHEKISNNTTHDKNVTIKKKLETQIRSLLESNSLGMI